MIRGLRQSRAAGRSTTASPESTGTPSWLVQRAYQYLPAELRERYYQHRTRPTQSVTGW